MTKAIRTTQGIRHTCVRYWQDTRGTTPSDLNKYCAILALTMLTPPTAGHAESHAWGEKTRYAATDDRAAQGFSLNQESHAAVRAECQAMG